MTTSFDKFIADFREKRENASPIYHSKMKHMIDYLCGTDEVGDYVIADFNRSMPNWKSDVEFCVFAANNITKLLEASQAMNDVLELFAKTDISEKPPDYIWLNEWRNYRKQVAINTLKKVEELLK